jgi:hypothetical protein
MEAIGQCLLGRGSEEPAEAGQVVATPCDTTCDMNSDELDRDMLSWLKSNSIDNQADYLSRGRRYSGLQDGMLLEEWKKVFRAMATEPDVQENRGNYRDLCAEIELRGLEAPLSEVEDAIDALVSEIEERRRHGDPDEVAQADAEFLEAFEEFTRQRHRAH